MAIRPVPEIDSSLHSSASSWEDSFRKTQTYLHELPCSSSATYSIAGNAVRLHYGSDLFKEQVSHAFSHLECANGSGALLTVLLHDLATAPGAAELLGALNLPGGETDIWLVDRPDLMLIVQRQGRLITAVDWRIHTAYWLVPDAGSIPYIERAAPLKLLLSHWLGMRGRYLVHAAAVGNAGDGVLILGHGGAGKSTTALSCLDAGLEYAADDHCLVSLDSSPSVHSIYGTGKLAVKDLGRFPSLAPTAEMDDRPPEEKAVFFFDRNSAIHVARSFPLRAILVARITGSLRTSLHRIGASEAFKAITPSCALYFPSLRARALGCFNTLVRQLPAYALELGSDVHSTPAAILELLDQLPGAKGIDHGCKAD
jgi:hypothetical protein